MFLNFFLPSLFATLCFIAILYPIALKFGFTDKPNHRKQHKAPTPLIGGVAIYLAILITLCRNTQELPSQAAFVVAISLLVFVSLIDDYKGLGIKPRLFVQVISALIMTEYADVRVENLGDIFGFGEINLGVFSSAFTVFAVVGGINAFNMIDGMDGLAGSLSLISVTSLALLSWLSDDNLILSYSLILMAAIIAFLSLNLRIFGRTNAKIFLGDNGSTLFGFIICWLAIDASQGDNEHITSATVLWILAIPLLDSVCIMLRRIRKGRSPFNPDREHLHHIFTVAGYSNNLTLIAIILISISLAAIGIIGSQYSRVPEYFLFWSFILLFAIHYRLMNRAWKVMKICRHLRMSKVQERRQFASNKKVEDRRNLADRRFVPSEQQVETIHSGSDRLIAHLLRQRIRKNLQTDRRKASYIEANIQGVLDKRYIGDRRNVRVKLPSARDEIKGNRKYEA